ncbi:beta strand repeat-containing protein [Hymenobacter elongatus]|uniref:T9SS type A sorting domain-containing protein n=1 Tax=Hymenobacter elongatus TaxID=877208 RepID=A0A4Z0PKK3_9BACT|nr:right-handed parallel beta-helix repeat-containing protein [Hymenobacter elongatus]TGE16125.1 T9SS type A sorting domain-containing protein [Hymenobacter elongatus]
MSTVLRLTALLLLWLTFLPNRAQAQAEGPAFSCDGTFYQIRQIGTGPTAFSALYVVNRSTAVYTTNVFTFGGTNTTGNLGVVLNALAYNPQDSYLYALSYPADNGTPDPAGIRLYRIGRSGIRELGITNLPVAQYNSGTIDRQGNFYLTTRQSAGQFLNTFFRLKLSNFATVLTSHDELPVVDTNGATVGVDFTDIAYSPINDTFYGSSFLEDLFKINVVTNAQGVERAVFSTVKSGANTTVVGSNFFDVAGNLYTYSNAGGIYSIDIATGDATLISTVDAAPNSDGASCINPSERIDVVKDLTSVTATGTARQFDVRFAIRVKNTGTSTATNVQVSDFLRGNAVNTTFPTSSTVTLVSGVVTNFAANVGVPPTLAFSNAFTGQGVNADLLTTNQSLTAGQSALIDLTVRVTFPNNPGTPTAASLNNAYASTTSGTSNQGHIQLTNGDVIPPGNLLAADQSTNSAALPLSPNADTPSGTPIRFSVAIQGTVFEDMNYGGDLGRSQATSNGQGLPSARVELYGGGGGFLNSTTTDASGNYEFTTGAGGAALGTGTTYQVRVVNSLVFSARPNPFAGGVLGVQTFINGNTNQVGGANPNQVDIGPNNSNASVATLQAQSTTTILQSLTTVTTPASGALINVDFGYNFDLVTNTNATGQGSLRQFILNSSSLANTNLAQEGLTAGKEHAIFMMNDGVTATNGLRGIGFAATGYSAITGVFTITLNAPFTPIFDDNTVIDGKLQSNRTGEDALVSATSTGAEVAIDFNRYAGLISFGANTRIASVALSNALGNSLNTPANAAGPAVAADGAAVTFSGANITGSVVTDITATANFAAGVRLQDNATGVTVSNNILRTALTNGANFNFINSDGAGVILADASTNTITGNTIGSNAGYGIVLLSGANSTNTISGNTIMDNGAGTVTTNDAGIAIITGNNNLISDNTVTGNSGDGIVAMSGTSGNRLTQNNTGSNNGSGVTGNLGIDLSSNGTATGDGVSLNADGKTAASGANSMLNFPVFTQATITAGGNLVVSGFAKAGVLIEFFVASADPTSFGEGATYLFNATEGSAGDTDTRLSSYTGGRTDLNHGSETGVNRFVFSIPVNATQRAALVANRLTATATVPATVNGLAVGNTSEFSGIIAVINNQPLPVELVTFEARAVGQNGQLTWATASEKNNDRFVLERSTGEQAFTQIATIKGAGTSAQGRTYGFTDAGIGAKHTGTVYYRLKQIDTDGTVNEAGPVRTLLFTGEKVADATLYPNPTVADTDTKLDLTTLPVGSYQVSIVDMMGRTLRTDTYAGGVPHSLNVQTLASGSYLVVVRGSNVKITKRLVKN